ncbi:hypothetical protein [Neisseria dentiae]|uniref:hypothetical protein n=1 Tax=Neisseria dentiae TaxID=194197 RepID=UPI000E07ACB8|nr:transposase IS4 family [Neisseria dentiae]
MIDATHIKVYPHAAGAKDGNESMSRIKGGLNTKLHLVVATHEISVKFVLSEGNAADCLFAESLTVNTAARLYRYRHLVENCFLRFQTLVEH